LLENKDAWEKVSFENEDEAPISFMPSDLSPFQEPN
jgi:hypothetical protein